MDFTNRVDHEIEKKNWPPKQKVMKKFVGGQKWPRKKIFLNNLSKVKNNPI